MRFLSTVKKLYFLLKKLILFARNPIPRYRKTENRRAIINQFHLLFFYTRYVENIQDTWLGVPILKYPTDLMMYQEILYELKPDMIIETGSEYGGSTLFFASICDMIGKGEVISIDRDHSRITATHPRITWVEGNSVCTETVARVRSAARDMGTIIVTLDSSHIKGHVLKEMELYATFVTPGSYLIVEDTKQNGHPIQTYYPPDYGPGPMEAVEDFLINHKEFRVDRSREKYLLTSNPGGFLRRIG